MSIDALVEAFLGDLMGVFGAQERLHAFAEARRREIASELGFPSGEDIDLPVWLESLAAAAAPESSEFGEASSFEKLREWFIHV